MTEPANDLLRRAVKLHHEGQLDAARELYEQVLSREPRDPNALNLLGMIHHQRGQQDRAEEFIRRAIAVARNVPGFHVNLATVMLAQRRMDLAEEACRRAAELQPHYAEAHNNLSVALLGQGKIEAAMEEAAAALRLRHQYPAARNNLGNAFRAKSMYHEAESCYRDALTQDPRHAEAQSNLAITMLSMHRHEDALVEAKRAIELRPNHGGSHMTLGLALEELGRKDEAIAVYRKVLAAKPDARALRFQLASLTGEATFGTAPPEFVAMLFDNYADTFDRHLVEGLRYRGPELVVDALKAAGAKQHDAEIADIGCGTGLCGVLLRPMARHLVGVDLSSRMIGLARQRDVYDELFVDEIVAFLRVRFAAYDVITATDVLNYIGDLRAVLSAAAQALAVGGTFALTLEKHDGIGFVLNPTRRFSHSIAYVRSLLAEARLQEVSATEAPLRRQGDEQVTAWVIVLRRD